MFVRSVIRAYFRLGRLTIFLKVVLRSDLFSLISFAYDHLEYFLMYEFCMVPHGQPFTGAAVDDWALLQKSSELRLEAEGESVVYVNRTLDDVDQSTFLRFVKIGLDGDMVRYAHDIARYNDLMLRKVPLQNAYVMVRVKHES